MVLCDFIETWRRERDEMEEKEISLSSHLRGRYQIFLTCGGHIRCTR
jgi:hypothetical protein